MKKILYLVSIVLFITSLILINNVDAAYELIMNKNLSSNSIQVGDEIIYSITLNENVVACNFQLNYDNTVLELIGSDTTNLNVAEKNGKIACIYADISGTGTNILKIKLKAKKSIKESNISMEDVKFRTVGSETSYTSEQIQGVSTPLNISILEKIENTEKKDNTIVSNEIVSKDNTVVSSDATTKKDKLPNTGKKQTGYVFLIASILLTIATIFKTKSNELEKILKSVSVIVLAIMLTGTIFENTVSALTIQAPITEIIYNDNLIENTKTIGIMLDRNDTSKTISKNVLMIRDTKIEDVLDGNNVSIASDANVATGYSVVIGDDKYKVILYGDANGDGIVCDTDDIMTIINDYLGIKRCEGINRIAANLENTDNILDIDDVMKMINMYIGNLQTSLVTNLPQSTIVPSTNGSQQPAEPEKIENDIQVEFNKEYATSWLWGNGTTYEEENPIVFGKGHGGYFDGSIKLKTNTNYTVQFALVNKLSKLEAFYSWRVDSIIEDINDVSGDINVWHNYSNKISVNSKFDCQRTYTSSEFEENLISYRLYDSATGKYSDEKYITVKDLLDGFGYTIMNN